VYQSSKCPVCRATDLIRTVQTGEYKPGECANCRADRSIEMPMVDMPEPGEPLSVIEKLPGGWFKLSNGKRVHGKAALEAALSGGSE